MPLGIKTGPTPGVTNWNQRNKDVEFICRENDSGERSRAIMALLFVNPFQNKPWSVCVCCSNLLKTLWEKEKFLETNNSFSHSVNPFPNKPRSVCVCCSNLLKTMWEKEKFLETNNSFSHSVFYPFR